MHDDLLQNISLSDYVSWKTSGPAKHFYQVSTLEKLQGFLKNLPKEEPLLWIGLGSNTLIRDGGFNGTVIFTQKGLRNLDLIDKTQVRAGAGVACPTMARFVARNNLMTGEWFAGVPGTIGGALQMNAGAFGGETWDHVVTVETIDHAGNIHIHKPEDFKVSYRHIEGPVNEWFVAATFQFEQGDKKVALEKIQQLLDKRSATQPTGVPTCGSVFRNPPGDYAARLIEISGLKGYRHGNAIVSEKHANFIVNEGDATAKDIEELIDYVAQVVQDKQGVILQREVLIVGDPA